MRARMRDSTPLGAHKWSVRGTYLLSDQAVGHMAYLPEARRGNCRKAATYLCAKPPT